MIENIGVVVGGPPKESKTIFFWSMSAKLIFGSALLAHSLVKKLDFGARPRNLIDLHMGS